jgi:prepilin-type N-terminal cleavage/methylation domain-containing protein
MKKYFNKNLSGFSLIELSIVILIIGILIAGVTQGSRLVRESRLTTAKTLTESSDVSSIPDLVLWLDATDETTIGYNGTTGGFSGEVFGNLEDDDEVSTWKDKNPQLSASIDLTQTTGTKRPLYEETGISGLPSISFDGTDDLLSNTSSVPITSGDDAFTIAVVWSPDVVSAGNRVVFAQSGSDFSTGDASAALHVATATAQYATDAASLDTINTVSAGSEYITIITSNSNTAGSVYASTNTAASITTDSSAIGTSAVSVGAVDETDGGTPTPANVASRFFDGKVSEVIVWDRKLKTTEIQDVNSYLSKKYSIPVS